jgi:SAM-dependent methyltransferase
MPAPLSAFEKLRRSIRSDGIRRSATRVWDHLLYLRRRWIDDAIDRRYGTDTGGKFRPPDLGSEATARDTVQYLYEGIQVPVFRRIARDLDLDCSRYTFVDFGSGKGRAVMMAAEHPFRKVIGVELSAMLHEIALRNVTLFRQRRPCAPPIELRLEDAVRYARPEGDTLCFFYNPFGLVTMEAVLRNLEDSLLRQTGALVVVYRNPTCAQVFERARFLRLRLARRDYHIYEAPSGPLAARAPRS